MCIYCQGFRSCFAASSLTVYSTKGGDSHDPLYVWAGFVFIWAWLCSLGHASSPHIPKELHECFWGNAPELCELRQPNGEFVPSHWNSHKPYWSAMFFFGKNIMAVLYLRCTLICMLLLAKHCFFILEQPSNTLLHRHHRWEHFCNQIAYAPGWKTGAIFSGCLVVYNLVYMNSYPPACHLLVGVEARLLDAASWCSLGQKDSSFWQLLLDTWTWPWETYKSYERYTHEYWTNTSGPQRWWTWTDYN